MVLLALELTLITAIALILSRTIPQDAAGGRTAEAWRRFRSDPWPLTRWSLLRLWLVVALFNGLVSRPFINPLYSRYVDGPQRAAAERRHRNDVADYLGAMYLPVGPQLTDAQCREAHHVNAAITLTLSRLNG